jgi:hypothetical protein
VTPVTALVDPRPANAVSERLTSVGPFARTAVGPSAMAADGAINATAVIPAAATHRRTALMFML